MADNNYKILLEAEIDKQSQTGIRSQIEKLALGLEPLGIKLNIDNKQIQNLQGQLEKLSKNSNKISFDMDKNGIVTVQKSIEKINDEMGNAIALTTKYKKGTNEVLSVHGELSNEYAKQQKYLQDTSDAYDRIAKKLNSLPKTALGTNDTNDMYALLNSSESLSDLKTLDKLVDDYYNKCIANEKRYQAEKKNANKDTINAFTDEDKKLDYIYQKKKQIFDLERQINNASINKGLDASKLETTGIYAELERIKNKSVSLSKEEKDNIDRMITALKQQVNVETDALNVVNKKNKAYTEIQSKMNRLNDVTVKNDKFDVGKFDKIQRELISLQSALEKGEISFTEYGNKIRKSSNDIQAFEIEAKKLSSTTNSLSDSLKRMGIMVTFYDALQLGKRVIREFTENIFELDNSLVELSKTTSLSSQQLSDFANESYTIGKNLSATITDVIDATSSFSRAGFSFGDSKILAEQAIIMRNISEGMKDTGDNATALTNILKGYRMEVTEAARVNDMFNNISNNQAVTFDQLVEGTREISGIMNLYGNTLEETTSMLTGMISLTGASGSEAAHALRTVTMRLSGMSDEGEKDVELMAKLNDEFKKIANIDLMTPSGEMRDMYDIVDEYVKKIEELNISQEKQAYLAEKVAGKHRASYFTAMVQNWTTVKESIDLANNSTGSAIEEQEKYAQSLQGHMDSLTASIQKLSMSTLDSNMVKGILKITDGVVRLIDKVGLLNVAMAATATYMSFSKNATVANEIAGLSNAFSKLAISVGMTNTALLGTIGLVAGGIGIAFAIFDNATTSVKELEEKSNDLKSEITELTSEYDKLNNIVNRTEAQELKLEMLQQEIDLRKKIATIINTDLEKQKLFGDNLKQVLTIGMAGKGSIKDSENISSNLFQEQTKYVSMKGQLDDENLSLEKQYELSQKLSEQKSKAVLELDSLITSNDELNNVLDMVNNKEITLTETERKQLENRIDSNNKQIENAKIMLDIIDISNSMNESSNATLENQNKSYDNMIDTMSSLKEQFAGASKNIDYLSVALSELDAVGSMSEKTIEELAKAYPELIDNMSTQESLEAAIREIQLSEYLDEVSESIEFLNGCINSLNQGQILTSDQIEKLITLYPELSDSVEIVNGAYTISVDKLVELRDQSYNTASQRVADENAVTLAVIEQVKQRIAVYNQEISKMRQLVSARMALNSFGSGVIGKAKASLGYDDVGFGEDMIAKKDQQLKNEEKALGELLNTLDRIENEQTVLDAKASGLNTKAGSGIKPKKEKSGKEKYASYIEEGLDDAIDAIKTKGDKLANEISILDEKISLAETQGDKDKQLEYLNQMDDYYEQKKDVLLNQRKDIATLTNDTLSHIKKAGIKGFSDMDMNLLDKQALGNITREYEKQIEQASVSSNKALEADLKNKLDFIKEHGNAIINIRELKAELDQTEIQNVTEQIQNRLDAIDLSFNIKTAKLDETDTVVSQLKNALEVATGLGKDSDYLAGIQSTISGVIEEEIKYNQSLIETLKEKRDVAGITHEEQTLYTQQINEQLNKQSSLIKDQISYYKELSKTQAEQSVYGSGGKDEWEKKNKDKIQAIKDEISAIQNMNKEKDEQAKIEEKILAIKEAEEKLEELKRNKSNQVLKKDKDGNWQFEYVADENAILDAQKDLNDKRDELDDIYEEQRKQDLINQLEEKIKLLEEESNSKNEKYTKMQDDLMKAKTKELEITMNENSKRQKAEKENMDVINQLVDAGLKTMNTTYEDQLSTILETVKRYMRQVREELSAINEVEQKTGGSSTGSKSSGRSMPFSLEPTESTKFKTGGETSRTGWHWLDGNSNSPERVLSAEQTKSFNKFIEMIPSLENKISKFLNVSDMFTQKIPNAIGKVVDSISNSTSNSSNTVNIQNISLPNVQNGREFVDELMDVIGDLSLQAGINPSK